MTIPPPPPATTELPAGTILHAGDSYSTVLPDFDFETYSPAGFVWDALNNKFVSLPFASGKGLSAVGTAVYTEDLDAEVLSLSYNLKDGKGTRLWTPDLAYPDDLISHVQGGGLLEAWNSIFEYFVWNNICVRRYGFPPLPIEQLRCAMSKARAFGLPGSLDKAGEILNIKNRKLKEGGRLLDLYSIPRNPTKKNPKTRNHLNDNALDMLSLYTYNMQDIAAESEISALIPDLNEFESEFWLCDQKINARGVKIDLKTINNAIAILRTLTGAFNEKMNLLTNGRVKAATQTQKIIEWLASQGVQTRSIDADNLETLLKLDLPANVRGVLECRQVAASSSVKKLYAMKYQASRAERLHNLFAYHSARTGRAAGRGAQPQNFPNSGIDLRQCSHCRAYMSAELFQCYLCKNILPPAVLEWNRDAMEQAIADINRWDTYALDERWKDPIGLMAGCLRGLFIAEKGHDLICSDYSAIEAVVLAYLAGEKWRIDVFKTHGMIYEMSASKITGIPFDHFLQVKRETGKHHDMRKLGKVAELASGYQGWINAWKAFNADMFLSEYQIKQSIIAWRESSPNIVEFWGGQQRYRQQEYFGLEGMAIKAILNPGKRYSHGLITYYVYNDILYCELPSKRKLTYHKPRLTVSTRREGNLDISFESWNSNPKYGAVGWIRMFTYGGKLTENVVQAVARDILANAIVNLERVGYPVVLHVHDEIVGEVPEGFGSIEEFEKIMSTMPAWASDWTIRAKGGWRAKRYSK